MPGRREGPGFRFTITNNTRDDQIGVVENRAERVAERIAQFAALMDGARTLR